MSVIKKRFEKHKYEIEDEINDWFENPIDIDKITPEKFNSGLCDFFADYLSEKYSDIERCSSRDIEKQFHIMYNRYPPDHAFIKYKDKYYDFDNIDGVTSPLLLNFYQKAINRIKKL